MDQTVRTPWITAHDTLPAEAPRHGWKDRQPGENHEPPLPLDLKSGFSRAEQRLRCSHAISVEPGTQASAAKPGEIPFINRAIPGAGPDSSSTLRNSLLAKAGFFYRCGITGCAAFRDAGALRIPVL